MTTRAVDLSQRQAALVAGFALLAMAILSLFFNFFVLEDLIVSGDAATTANNILASEGLFRVGVASILVVIVLDVVAAWALYEFLKPVNGSLALLTAWFRLVFATVFGVAVLNLFLALELVEGDGYLAVLDPTQVHAQMLFFLEAFDYGWLIGLVLFGLHLAGLGYLVLRSGYVPRVLGVLLIAAALGYLIDSFAHFLLSNYDDYETVFLLVVAVPGVVGELSFAVWLLAKGGKGQPRDNRALGSASLVPGAASG
jgi:hypothetical protein